MDEKFDVFLDSNEADAIFGAIQTAIREVFTAGYELGKSENS